MRQQVVFILDSFSGASAGTESQIILLLRSLDRARFEPRVALLRGPDELSRHVPGVPVEILGIRRIGAGSAWWRAWRYARGIRRAGARVAQIFFNDASVIFPLPLRLAGVRVVVARRDLGFWYTPTLLKLLRFSGRFVDAVVCNARAVRDAVVSNEHVPIERTTIIHNGATRELGAEQGADPRGQLRLPAEAPLIAIVANLRPLKRLDTAIKALARLSHLTPAPHLVVAGADRVGDAGASHRAELEALAVALGVRERVHFIGAVSDPMPVIRSCDVAILCSESEGLSNSLIEYLLAGRPVVCTPAGGNRELIDEGQTGYFFDVGDDAALAMRLAELFADEVRRKDMGQRAAATARLRFDPNRMVSAHEKLYEHLATSGRARLRALPLASTGTGDLEGHASWRH